MKTTTRTRRTHRAQMLRRALMLAILPGLAASVITVAPAQAGEFKGWTSLQEETDKLYTYRTDNGLGIAHERITCSTNGTVSSTNGARGILASTVHRNMVAQPGYIYFDNAREDIVVENGDIMHFYRVDVRSCVAPTGPVNPPVNPPTQNNGGWVNEGGPAWKYRLVNPGVEYSSPHGWYGVSGSIKNHHSYHGGGKGYMGYPVSHAVGQGGPFAYQKFERGDVYTSHRGTFTVEGWIARHFNYYGGGSGLHGYPTSDMVRQGGSYAYQQFERGVIYTSNRGVFTVDRGTMIDRHYSYHGGGTGRLGYPTSNRYSLGGGWYGQNFERGIVHANGSSARDF